MRTLIATIAATCLLSLSGAAHAQQRHASHGFFKNGITFGLDTGVSIPLGNYADANSVGGQTPSRVWKMQRLPGT